MPFGRNPDPPTAGEEGIDRHPLLRGHDRRPPASDRLAIVAAHQLSFELTRAEMQTMSATTSLEPAVIAVGDNVLRPDATRDGPAVPSVGVVLVVPTEPVERAARRSRLVSPSRGPVEPLVHTP